MRTYRLQRGFTLAEALVAAAVTAALAAALAPAVFGASRLVARIEAGLAREEALRRDASLLRTLALSSMRPPPEMDGEYGLRGGARTLNFIADPPDTLGPVWIDVQAEGNALSVRVSKLYDGPEPLAAAVLEGWSDLSFRYWGAPDSRTEPAWAETWVSPKPPRLWTIEGVFEGERRRIDLLFGAEAPVFCRFDPVIRRCRGTP